jgi:hypothetical protein
MSIGKAVTLEIFHRKIRRSEGLVARRAFGAQRDALTRRRQREPRSLLDFCPSDLPVKKSGSVPTVFGFASD